MKKDLSGVFFGKYSKKRFAKFCQIIILGLNHPCYNDSSIKSQACYFNKIG